MLPGSSVFPLGRRIRNGKESCRRCALSPPVFAHGFNLDSRSDTVPVAASTDWTKTDPLVATPAIVAIQVRTIVYVDRERVNSPVVVVVAKGHTACGFCYRQVFSGSLCNLLELPVAEIPVDFEMTIV